MILKKITISLFLCAVTLTGVAQKNVAKFFPAAAVPSGGSTNLQNLLSGYITPIAEDFGTLGNNGWYTTAEVHKQWGFDLNVTVNTININSDATTFPSPPLTGITYLGGTTPLQTVYGREGLSPTFLFNAGPNTGISFEGADGADPGKDLPVGSLAVPTLQFGLGVFKGTDLRIRYTPTVKVNNVELSNWGIGLMHNIKQHIPGLREVPFSLSVFAGYTSLKVSTDLSGFYSGSGQQGVAQTNAITAQLLASKEIKFLSLYGGLGYNSSTTDYKINGTYQVNTTNSGQSLPGPIALTNPFIDSYKKGGIRVTAGLRLRFGPITLNGDYTIVSRQSLLTAGFGVTVR